MLSGQKPFAKVFIPEETAYIYIGASCPHPNLSVPSVHRRSALSQRHNYMETIIMGKPGPVQLNLSVFGEMIQIPAGPGECTFHSKYLTIAPICGNNLHTCQKLRFKKRFRNFSHKCPPCQEQANTSTVSSTYFTMQKAFFSFLGKSLPKGTW